jgi:hypothetical protein
LPINGNAPASFPNHLIHYQFGKIAARQHRSNTSKNSLTGFVKRPFNVSLGFQKLIHLHNLDHANFLTDWASLKKSK